MSLVVAFLRKKKCFFFVAFRVQMFSFLRWNHGIMPCDIEEHMEQTNRVGTFVDHCCFPAVYVYSSV